MCRNVLRMTGLLLAQLLALLLLGSHPGVQAQVATAPPPAWRAEPSATGGILSWQLARDVAPALRLVESPQKHSHTWTGLLVGGLVGGAATAVFLAAFCGDPDTVCGADEVGRVVVIIAVPVAAAGALIGSLILTK